MQRIVFTLLSAALGVAVVSAQPASPGPSAAAEAKNVWSTQTYRFPAPELVQGFVSSDQGQLNAPSLPKADAANEDLTPFLRRSDGVVTQYLKGQGIVVPQGSLAAFDPANLTLVIRTTTKTHELLAGLSQELIARLPHTLNFAAYLIEAEAATVRQLVKDTEGKGDHSAQLARLRELVSQGKARQADFLRIETRSGQRAVVERGAERTTASGFQGGEQQWTEVIREMRQVGSRLEIDPVLGSDGEDVDMNLRLEHHYRTPVDRWESAALNPSGKRLDLHVTDFFTVEAVTAQTIKAGSARLLGVWKPEGVVEPARESVLLVAMIRADKVPLLALLDPRVEQILKAQGEKFRATPAAVPQDAVETGLPKGMIIRRFRVTPTFLSTGASRDQSAVGGAAAADPFAAATPPKDEPRMTVRITALDILRSQGVPFPPGSSANFNTSTNELIVRNTTENMARVAEFIELIRKTAPMNVAFSVEIVQADAAFLRKLEEDHAALADHGVAWNAIEEAIAQGKAKFVQTLWVGTRSGQRSTTQMGREYSYFGDLSKLAPPKASTEKGKEAPAEETPLTHGVAVAMERRRTGVDLEIDPVIGPDGRTLDINYSLSRHYLQPTVDPVPPGNGNDPNAVKLDGPASSFHTSKTISAVTVLAGMPRLIGLWKPEGAPEFDQADVMQAAFLRADIQSVSPTDK